MNDNKSNDNKSNLILDDALWNTFDDTFNIKSDNDFKNDKNKLSF